MRNILLSGIGLTLLSACYSGEPLSNEDTTASGTADGQTGDGMAVSGPGTPTSSATADPFTTTDASGGASTATSAPDGDATDPVSSSEAPDTLTGDPSMTDGEASGTVADDDGTGGSQDVDADGVPDPADNCPSVVNEDQVDVDMNGIGDVCEDDEDDDNDGLPDGADNCPLVPNPDQKDLDGDGIGEVCDEDMDGDAVPQPTDNCPTIPNPAQKDTDNDSIGDACDADKDGDSIPNDDDVFPSDGGQPGVVTPNKMYAHSKSVLSMVDGVDYSVTDIGAFTWPEDGGSHMMSDIAIDRHGVLYGITDERAYVCNPTTAACFLLGTLPGSFVGLTWIPAGTLDPGKDSLIGITEDGTWNHLKIINGQISSQLLGSYGPGYSGVLNDAVSIEGVGTYAAVRKGGIGNILVVSVDPLTGKVLEEVAFISGFQHVYGLAGWGGLIIGFEYSGAIIKLDPKTKVVTNLGKKGISWWGAGVGTILPP